MFLFQNRGEDMIRDRSREACWTKRVKGREVRLKNDLLLITHCHAADSEASCQTDAPPPSPASVWKEADPSCPRKDASREEQGRKPWNHQRLLCVMESYVGMPKIGAIFTCLPFVFQGQHNSLPWTLGGLGGGGGGTRWHTTYHIWRILHMGVGLEPSRPWEIMEPGRNKRRRENSTGWSVSELWTHV